MGDLKSRIQVKAACACTMHIIGKNSGDDMDYLGACHVQVPHIYLYARSTPVSCHMHGLKKISAKALTLQISHVELPLVSFLLILSSYGENLGGRGFITGFAYNCHWIQLMESYLPISNIDIPLGEVSQRN